MRSSLFLLILLSFTIRLSSQTSLKMFVEGDAKQESGELIAKTMRDDNGEVCAGLIIYSDLKGLTYQSNNGIVKRTSDPGKDLLFLSADERLVEVYCNGYTPLKIILNEQGIRLKSGQTWSIKVTGDKKLDVVPVNFIVKPEGAIIFVDGVNKGTNTTQQIADGKHEIRVEKEGYKIHTQTITVSTTQNLFSINLQEVEIQTVTILSVPDGAKIYIDNVERGETPKQPFLYPNTYSLRLTKTGYLDVQEKIEVKENITNKFTYTMTKNAGTLIINVTPSDAQVSLNNVDYSNKKTIELLPGTYAIQIQKSGYLSQTGELQLEIGKTVTKTYSLIKNSGTLTLNVTPSDARILINREDFSGKKSIELSPGRYKIEIDKTGYNGTNETVDIEIGKSLEKTFSLTAKTGGLQFSVTPIDAKGVLKQNNVIVQQWEGAKILRTLTVGDYELEVSASGYAPQKKRIAIIENKTITEDITLKKGAAAATSSGGIDFVYVEGGTFQMGSNVSDDEKPIHSVTVNSFSIGKYEITQKQWQSVMGNNPSNFKGENLPVENVSWNDIQEFITKLNRNENTNAYRLPTEAEWEYAARGGNKSKGYTYSGSNTIDNVAWYSSNSGSTTHTVGTKQANELGIYDMTGNVWEWCSDWYDASYYQNSPSSNPQGASSGSYRVLRGGSWNSDGLNCRVAYRFRYYPVNRYDDLGFRLLRTN